MSSFSKLAEASKKLAEAPKLRAPRWYTAEVADVPVVTLDQIGYPETNPGDKILSFFKSIPESALTIPIDREKPPICPLLINRASNGSIFEPYSDKDKEIDTNNKLDETIKYWDQKDRKMKFQGFRANSLVHLQIEDGHVTIFKEGNNRESIGAFPVDGKNFKLKVLGKEVTITDYLQSCRFIYDVKKVVVVPPSYAKADNEDLTSADSDNVPHSFLSNDEEEDKDNVDGLKEGFHAMALYEAGPSSPRYMTRYQRCLSESKKL